MSVKFASGETSDKFDGAAVNSATTKEVKLAIDKIESVQEVYMRIDSFDPYRGKIDHHEQLLHQYETEDILNKTLNTHYYLGIHSKNIDYMEMWLPMITIVLRSRLMRFINYFTHWYIMDIFEYDSFDNKIYTVYFKPTYDEVAWKSTRDHYLRMRKIIKRKGLKFEDLPTDSLSRL